MPARTLLSSEQRTRLFSIPSDTATMTHHYVLDADDLALIRTKRRSVNRVGFAVQLCLLRYPGFGLGPAEQPSETMIAFVAHQLGVPSTDFADYARRGQTRREHVIELQRYLGLRSFGLADWRACPCRLRCGVGHGSRRAHCPGDARPSTSEPGPAPFGDGAGAHRIGRPCPGTQEDLRGACGRTVRYGAGYAGRTALGRSGPASVPLRLVARLF